MSCHRMRQKTTLNKYALILDNYARFLYWVDMHVKRIFIHIAFLSKDIANRYFTFIRNFGRGEVCMFNTQT